MFKRNDPTNTQIAILSPRALGLQRTPLLREDNIRDTLSGQNNNARIVTCLHYLYKQPQETPGEQTQEGENIPKRGKWGNQPRKNITGSNTNLKNIRNKK